MKAILDHIGIAVSDLPASLRFFRDELGLHVEASEEIASQKVRAHFLSTGSSSLEMLEATAPDSPILRFLDKRGLGYARLRELNPAIVMCTISGYGATGPYRDLPSHGIAYYAWAGTLQPVVDDDGFCRIPDQANIGITCPRRVV